MIPANERPRVIVLPHRPSRGSKGLVLAVVVLLVATVGLVVRATVSDWRGLTQEVRYRAGSWFAHAAKPPTLVAKVDSSKPEVPKAVAPKADQAPSPWDDIKNSAEKAKTEREEAERIKARAAEELDKNPPPLNVPFRRGRAIDPAVLAELQRRHAEAVRQMQAQMDDHQRLFEEMIRRQSGAQRRFMEEFARNAPRGFGNLPPGFENFARPPRPGINRDNQVLPGEPQIHEDAAEEVRDGVRLKWKTRVIILGR